MSVNERCVGNWQFQAFNNSNCAVYDDDGLQLFVTALLTVPINPPAPPVLGPRGTECPTRVDLMIMTGPIIRLR